MVILALQCIVQDHRHRNLHHFVRKPSIGLAQQQRLDGSFGDLRTTALVMQVLEEVENEPADNWNRSAALAWLVSQQRPDGSFNGDVRTTAEAMLGVAPRGLASIRALDCGQGPSDGSLSRLTTSNSKSPIAMAIRQERGSLLHLERGGHSSLERCSIDVPIEKEIVPVPVTIRTDRADFNEQKLKSLIFNLARLQASRRASRDYSRRFATIRSSSCHVRAS